MATSLKAAIVRRLLLFLLSSCVVSAGDFGYTTNDSEVTITSYMGGGGDVAIPSEIDGLPVRGIGDSAFWGRLSLTSVAIPESVTSIGDLAFFGCNALTTITIPVAVNYIGRDAFTYCGGLKSITVDAKNSSFSDAGGALFNKNQSALIQFPAGKIGAYVIPNTVASIGNEAFWGGKLTNITIADSVTSIGAAAFSACNALTCVTIPAGVTNIGRNAFSDCESLSTITVDAENSSFIDTDGVLFNKNQSALIQFPAGKNGAFAIPSSVVSIDPGAFSDCYRLYGVTIGESVTNIGEHAFSNCYGFTSIAIPKSVTFIGMGAFEHCMNLIEFAVDPLNPTFSSSAGVLFDKEQTTLLSYPLGQRGGGFSVPNGVKAIGTAAFEWADTITNITLPDSLTEIENLAFCFCARLSSITIPASVASIRFNAFAGCASLTALYFKGNRPDVDLALFDGAESAVIYYLPDTTGWDSTLADRPTALWNPKVSIADPSFGFHGDKFAFTITGTAEITVVVEASPDLANAIWTPLSTNTLTGGSSYFSDPGFASYTTRAYRLRSP